MRRGDDLRVAYVSIDLCEGHLHFIWGMNMHFSAVTMRMHFSYFNCICAYFGVRSNSIDTDFV